MEIFKHHRYHKIRQFYRDNMRLILPVTIILFILAIIIFTTLLSTNAGLATRMLLQTGNRINANINPMGFFPTLAGNLFRGFYTIALGIIPFLFLPALLILLDGSIIGIILGSSAITTFSTSTVLEYLLPHGIFQLSALIIAAAYGIFLCRSIILHILKKQRIESAYALFIQLANVYIFVIAPLMIIASFIEVFITPIILRLL